MHCSGLVVPCVIVVECVFHDSYFDIYLFIIFDIYSALHVGSTHNYCIAHDDMTFTLLLLLHPFNGLLPGQPG